MIASLLLAAAAAPPAVPPSIPATIEDIRRDPRRWDGKWVQIEGWINSCSRQTVRSPNARQPARPTGA